ncbi:hypothetical protein [Odoribacter splanchnicus]|nr:hypothetical protein [Odoribacter splanchnicus]
MRHVLVYGYYQISDEIGVGYNSNRTIAIKREG